MRLYDEIFHNVEGAAFARCIIAVGGNAYFQGVRSVGDFSSKKIVLYFKEGEAVIEGEELSVGWYGEGDLLLNGKVLSYRVERARV